MTGDHDDLTSPSSTPNTTKLFPFKNSYTAITLYTIFAILRKMKREIGLEAMLEYMDFYRALIEHDNPQFKNAVGKALELISVEKIYADAMKRRGDYEKDSI